MTVGEKEMAIAELQAKYVKLGNLSNERINKHMNRQTLKIYNSMILRLLACSRL